MQGLVARQPISSGKDHVRISFELTQDEDGYPPATSETMWAVPLGQSRFRLDNIPFFVCGVSCYDIISARTQTEGPLKFERLIEFGGHSTVRVIVHDKPTDGRSLSDRVGDLRGRLRGLGCSSELSHIPRLFSIDVPPEVELAEVKRILDSGEKQDLWEYEEATIAHSA
jgi:hypothetical protein